MKLKSNKCILIVTYAVVALFVLMIVWIGYLDIVGRKNIENNSYNKRVDSWAENVVRGSIYSADGNILAQTVTDENGTEKRVYPYDNLFSHAIGYNSNGKSGLELKMNYYLLTSNDNELVQAVNQLSNQKSTGFDVITTLDTRIGEVASAALGNNKGAVVVLDASTGEVLCEISKPDFNPNTIEEEWSSIIEDSDNSPLLNRATAGQYPPGSTFKLVTLLEYIIENESYDDFSYNCTGSINYNGSQMSCIYHSAHGNVNLSRAFAYSCNCSFATIGIELDMTRYKLLCDKLMFNTDLFTDFECKKSSFYLDENSTDFDIMQTAIGQGKTLMTPMHNAMIMSAVANDGVLVKPHTVAKVVDKNGREKMKFESESKTLLTSQESEILKKYLRDVVTFGTATNLNNKPYTAYGKTGSAQFDDSNPNLFHSWFTGFAEIGDRTIVVCAVVESTYDGGNTGKAIAQKVFDCIAQQ